MSEILLIIIIGILSFISLGWVVYISNKFLKFFIPIVKEIRDEQKKN